MKAILLVSLLPASLAALAASLDLANDPATGDPGKFAAEEIRREAAAKGMTFGSETKAHRIALAVEKDPQAAAQSYSIRVQNEGGRLAITVRGGMRPAQCMAGWMSRRLQPRRPCGCDRPHREGSCRSRHRPQLDARHPQGGRSTLRLRERIP